MYIKIDLLVYKELHACASILVLINLSQIQLKTYLCQNCVQRNGAFYISMGFQDHEIG